MEGFDERLVESAMAVILAAGEARDCCAEAMRYAREGNFEKADEIMKEAKAHIVEAHNGQTEVLQEEASGKEQKINLLFIHAQDTLMTIMSEINMTREMIEICRLIYDRKDESK